MESEPYSQVGAMRRNAEQSVTIPIGSVGMRVGMLGRSFGRSFGRRRW